MNKADYHIEVDNFDLESIKSSRKKITESIQKKTSKQGMPQIISEAEDTDELVDTKLKAFSRRRRKKWSN